MLVSKAIHALLKVASDSGAGMGSSSLHYSMKRVKPMSSKNEHKYGRSRTEVPAGWKSFDFDQGRFLKEMLFWVSRQKSLRPSETD